MAPIEMIYVASLLLGGGYMAIASVLHFVGGGGHDSGHDGDIDPGGMDIDADGMDFDADGMDIDADAMDFDADGMDADAADIDTHAVEVGSQHAMVQQGHHGVEDVRSHGVSFFSPLVLSSLLFSFGVMGFVVHHWVAAFALLSLGAAAVMAAIGGGGVYWSINRLSRIEGGSETRVAQLLGHQADVSVAIPAKGFGEIVYVRNQTRYNAPARSLQGVPIPRGAKVFIGGIDGSTFAVEEAGRQRIRRLAKQRGNETEGSE